MDKKPLASIVTVIVIFTLALATTGLSSSPLQKGRTALNGNLQIPSYVVITGDDISKLPRGENHIVQKTDDGNSSANVPTGSVIFTLDSGNQSVPLIKTGTGTLILPRSGTDLTKVGSGTLQNSGSSPSMTKELTGTLILARAPEVIYVFTHLGIFKFSQVFMPTEDNSGASVVDIKTHVQQQRPEGAMKGWPFNRLLIGPAAGIAQVEGWKAGSSKGSSTAKYVCQSGKFCQCSGTVDCLSLVNSNSCASQMNCDGAGNTVKCYCATR
jgi:hypothetical protein